MPDWHLTRLAARADSVAAMNRLLVLTLAALVVCAARAGAQAPLHDVQYPDADIAYGLSVYNAKCVTCHGPQGDAAGGVNLRSGTFRNATTDQELTRFIRAGSPAGMPAMILDNAEMTGIIAFLRNMAANNARGCGPLSLVAGMASNQLAAPVTDNTGLTGTFAYSIYFSGDPLATNSDVPSFPTALREQFGLKLEPARGPVDVLVIDSVQPPTQD